MNIVRLTYREHYIAHWLLTKLYPDGRNHFKMQAALLRFGKGNNGLKISSHQYEIARKNFSELCKISFVGEGNPAYGYRWTEEQKNNLKRNHVGTKGQHIHSEEHKKALSKSMLGNDYGKANKGRILTEAHKRHLSETRLKNGTSEKQKQVLESLHEKNIGCKWFNDGKQEKFCKECPSEGWVRGRLSKKIINKK